MIFSYRAIDAKGKKTKGELNAADKAAAISMLKGMGLVPTQLTTVKKLHQYSAAEPGKKRALGEIEIMEKDYHEIKIKKKKILGVLNQFAIMMKAGVSLSLCMEVLLEQEKDRRFRKILSEIKDDMYSGQMLSVSMSKFKAFNEITINIVAAGEVNGRLDTAFERAAQILENEVNITAKVKNAVTYPIFLLCLTTVVVILLNALVLPIFADMFSRMDAQLPLITRLVMGSSHMMTTYWYLYILVIVILAATYTMKKKTSADFRRRIDHVKLRIPLIGPILHKLYLARFARMMSSLVDAGVEIVHALTVSSAVIPNSYIRGYLVKVLEDVQVGVPINRSMSQYPVFDSLLVSMIRVGEESGMLYDVLDKMADLFESQTDAQTKQLTALMEPAMTIIIAVVVGTVIVSVVLPMFGQYNLIM